MGTDDSKLVHESRTRCSECKSTNLNVVGTSNVWCEDCGHCFIVTGANYKIKKEK